MTTRGKAVLVDGNSLLYRAFFAMPHFSTLENQPTNAVYGFTMMLLRLLEEKPEILIVAFDAPVRTFRHHEYQEYKAQRKRTPDELLSQAPLAREMVDAFNIPLFEIEGFEADDVVGTLAREAESGGYEVVIVTGDLDALQLVNDHVRVMTTVKGVSETVIYDEKAVVERFGFLPAQLPDYKGLKGDTSDNIPGVPGIGEKTAQKLINQYGSLERVLESADEVKEAKVRNALIEWADQARLSKRLGTIVTNVELDLDLSRCRYRKPDNARLREIFKRLEFRSLLKKLPEETPQGNLFDMPGSDVAISSAQMPLTICTDPRSAVEDLRRAKGIALRVHGDSHRGIDARPLGIALTAGSGQVCYCRFGGDTGVSLDDFRSILESPDIPKYGHDLKRDIEIARRHGVELRGPMFDVMLASYLINPARSTHSLEGVAFDYAGIELPSEDKKAKPSSETESADQEMLTRQVDAIMQLVPVLGNRLMEDDLGNLMANIEMPLVPILAEMELAGVSIDTAWLRNLSADLGGRIAGLEMEIYSLAGLEFNIGSPKQLQSVLFDKLGLQSSKKTKTGYSTDADTLAALAPAHEVVAKILEYRELTKLRSTYADALPKLINPETGKIHTSLNQAVTSTGRLSSSEPNLQNIPIKTEIGREIRKAFVASSGNLLVSADYSQIELRILAHVSHDPELIEAFRTDQDIHTRTATTIFGVPAGEVTADMRRQAKTVNFAVIYGMSDYGLSRELGIPPGEAKRYIESYFAKYPGVKSYERETLSEARTNGYVETLLGRRRYIPELQSPNRSYREFGERAAVNMPIQGTAADIVKLAMIRVDEMVKSRGFKAKLVLQVHDELVFDVPEPEVPLIVLVIREAMERAYALDVPLRVEIKAGKDWCTAQPLTEEPPTAEF